MTQVDVVKGVQPPSVTVERTGAVFERVTRPYRLMLPAMFALGAYVQLKKFIHRCLFGRGRVLRTNAFLFDGVSVNGRRIKEGAARWPALDTVYNFEKGEGDTLITRVFDGMWLRIRNAQAVRNRLVLVKRELKAAIIQTAADTPHRPVRVLSLAAGAAQGVIEVIADVEKHGIPVEVTLVDQDPTALAHARVLAARHRVEHSINVVEGNVLFYERHANKDAHPDIIEMCGLLDYLRDKTAISLIRKINRTLRSGGYFLTCHIHPNGESYFLRQVVDWGMFYRTVGELEDLLAEGLFLSPRFATEPHRIHSVAVVQKV